MQSVISRVHRLVTAPAEGATPFPPPSGGPLADGALVSEPAAVSAAPLPATPPPVAEMRLAAERLQFAMLLGERKKAVAALLAMAKGYDAAFAELPKTSERVVSAELEALGGVAIPVVLTALVSDPRDTELMEAMLELLQFIVSRAPATASALLLPAEGGADGAKSGFARAAAPATWGMQICMQLLQDPSPWIRGPTVALVKCVQAAQPKEFAVAVLECKEGLRRLLEVVEDRREHIRDAALQVVVKLTERDKNAQQFLAFEDGFARLFQIMESEGLADSSSVISDCLQIVNNMLRDNLMTQTLFLEQPFLESHLPALLRASRSSMSMDGSADDGATATQVQQKKRTLKLTLQLVRFLVTGLYEGIRDGKLDEVAQRDQKRKETDLGRIQSLIVRQSALMSAIGELACSHDEALTDLQLQALDLLELLSTGNGGNQIVLVNLHALPSRRSVLTELVRLDVGEEETPVSVAATSLLDALFQGNESAKMSLFQHVHAPPPSIEGGDEASATPAETAGRVLLDTFVVNAEKIVKSAGSEVDPVALRSSLISAWKASHRLSSVLGGSRYCQELALRIPGRYDDVEAQVVSGGLLLSRCIRLLSATSSSGGADAAAYNAAMFQVHVAVLLLLNHWCRNCTKAVGEIVGSVTNLSILFERMQGNGGKSSSRDGLEQTQIRGLVALLLGACLEFLIEEKDATAVATEAAARSAAASRSGSSLLPGGSVGMTREQLLDMIGNRVGLAVFTDALVQFQQSPVFVTCARGSNKALSSRMLLSYRAVYDVPDSSDTSSLMNDDDDNSDAYLFLLYDKSFTLYYRSMADVIQKRIIAVYTSNASGAGDSNMGSASAAYQDLIRMQDKQIHDLEQQLANVRQALQAASHDSTIASNGSPMAVTDPKGAGVVDQDDVLQLETKHEQYVQALQQAFEEEKAGLESKIRTATEATNDAEARLNGLTLAFEHLESEHQQCLSGREVYSLQSSQDTVGNAEATCSDSALIDQLRTELETERQSKHDIEQQLRLAIEEREVGTIETLRLKKHVENLRMQLEEKQDEVADSHNMLETLNSAQSVLKKENESLQSQLAAVTSISQEPKQLDAVESCDDVGSNAAAMVSLKQRLSEVQSFQIRLCADMARELSKEEESRPNSDQVAAVECETVVEDDIQRLWREIVHELTGLRAENAVVIQRVDELEHSARTAFEEDKKLLQTRILEVETARQNVQDTSTSDEHPAIGETKSVTPKVAAADPLPELVSTQLSELQELRTLLGAMKETSASEIADRDSKIAFLQELVGRNEAQSRQEKRKFQASVDELEAELARAFLARTEVERKSKATVKELEAEVARLFLSKVEMEKQISSCTAATSNVQFGDANKAPFGGGDGGEYDHNPAESIDGPEYDLNSEQDRDRRDDMFILLASLEIECKVLREQLNAAGGADAVATATQRSRELGAVITL